MVQGCLLWQMEGLNPPKIVLDAVAEYRAEEDTLADFLDESIRWRAGGQTTHKALFGAYLHWAAENKLRHTLTSRMLAKRLRERAWEEVPGNPTNLTWLDVTLLEEDVTLLEE